MKKLVTSVLNSVGLISEKADGLETVKIPTSSYMPGTGAFGIISGNAITYHTCRDQFQGNSSGISEFTFNYSGKIGDIVEFMRTVEQIIRLPEEDSLKFSHTNVKDVLHVRMGEWWAYAVRRSLLTALLRCAQAYTTHSGAGFEKALWSQPYTSSTKHAVSRFLSGYTASALKTKRGFSGWQASFTNTSSADKFLVKLKRKKPAPEVVADAPPDTSSK